MRYPNRQSQIEHGTMRGLEEYCGPYNFLVDSDLVADTAEYFRPRTLSNWNGELEKKFDFKTELLEVDGRRVGRIDYYNCNEDIDSYDYVLIVQHDGDVDAFIEQNPWMEEVFADELGFIRDYAALDRDSGTAFLANYIAARLASFNASVVVSIVESLPRALLDVNISKAKAIRLPQLMENTEVNDFLIKAYDLVNSRNEAIAAKAKILMDIHNQEKLFPNDLQRGQDLNEVKLWVRRQLMQQNVTRVDTFITKDEKDQLVADIELAESLIGHLDNSGIKEIAMNTSYRALREYGTYRFMKIVQELGGSACAIDFIKDRMGEYKSRELGAVDFEVQEAKVRQLGEILIAALRQHFASKYQSVTMMQVYDTSVGDYRFPK